MDENKLMLLFLSKKLGTNDPKKILKYLKGLDKQKLQALAQEYQLWKESQNKLQAQKAAHGAKLQYIKSLKHTCPEGEELVYYKKGGSVTCGCKKKEEGGEVVQEAKCGAAAKFKKAKKMSKGGDSTKIVNSLSTITGTKAGFDRAAKEKKKERKPVVNVATEEKNPGSTKQPMIDALQRKYHKNDYKNLKCGGKTLKAACGCAVSKFKKDKCGGKMKKHQLGGSLNRIPFYLGGTNKGGVKSDNTKVAKIPNNGEGVYERIPQGIGDFLPLVGTMRAALRIDKEEPNASYGDLAMNFGMDVLGGGMVGSVIKAAGKASRLSKLLKSRGYFKITNESPQWFKIGSKEVPIKAGEFGTIGFNKAPAVYTRTIPEVDYTNAVMTPLVQTLRVPATASFKK